ncbi:hypothetical protein L1049_014899 [Liquidambar formosana]
METIRQRPKPSHPHLPHLHLLFLIFVSYLVVTPSGGKAEEEPVGYGYTVRSITVSDYGKVLTAHLQLIKTSSVFGPDIHNLSLIAR